MKSLNPEKRQFIKAAGLGLALLGLGACGMMMHLGMDRPEAREFGLGPRTSAQGIYTATLIADQPVKTRQLQTLQVKVADAAGQAVDGADITVDGGMPQHGHGLPTRPRVTRYLGDGVYEIDGVRFNMGGWWEFKLAVDSPRGSDIVTFNLDL